MKILVLGGTRFVGRHLVAEALARGHDVTLFNRGERDPDVFPEAERLVGDREAGDLDALRGRRWDAAIDTSGYVPARVRASAELLADAVERFAFVSSVSVYRETLRPGAAEDAPVYDPRPDEDEVTPETYGGMKVAGEHAVRAVFGDDVLIARPGVVVGPHDYLDRFPWWTRRIAEGGEVLAPEPDQPVQVIDARDMGAWIVRMLERGAGGTFNAVGPQAPLTFAEFFEGIRAGTGSDARPVWTSDRFLLEQGVEPFADLPLWITEPMRGFATVDNSAAVEAGLRFRPLVETAADVLAFERARPDDADERAGGMTREREAELLVAWRAGANDEEG